jgi:cholesterol transport system auxiliary component
MKHICMAVLAALVLGACGGGLRSGSAEPVTYVLRAAPATAAPAAAAPALAAPSTALSALTLQVTRVLAQPGYAGDRILLLHADHSLDFYATSRWPEPLPAVVATLAAETLRNGGALRAVHDDAAPFSSDYALRIAIRRFDAQYAGDAAGTAAAPTIHVSLECTVGRTSNRAVLAAFAADVAIEARDNRMGAVIEAFEQAAQAALAQVSVQTLAVVAADAQNVPKPLASMIR